MERKFIYGLIILGLVLSVGVVGAWTLFRGSQDHTAWGRQGDLGLSATLDKVVLFAGDIIEICLTLSNNGNKNITFWIGPPFFDVYLYDPNDNLVARWTEGRAFPEHIMEIVLKPGENFSETIEWNLYSHDHETGRFIPVKPGEYGVSSVWLGEPRIETSKIPITVKEGEYTESGAVETAKEFLQNCPTFRFDGIPSSIKVEEVAVAYSPWTWNVQLSFSCTHSGYGDRTGKILLQVITPHKIWVVVQRGAVVSAVIDEIWDEMNQKFLEANIEVIQARDLVMDYIKSHHKETARLIGDIKWIGGDITRPELVGKTTYQYTGDGWNITISWPVVPKPTYEVTAEYRSPTEDLQIVWRGTVDQDGAVTEKIKTSHQGVERVRDAVMEYIRENHPDAAVFIRDLEWSGGRVTPPDLVGYETYVFTSAKPTDTAGWNVTIGYPVVHDVTYEVTAQYNGITWTGTVHDGMVCETSYESLIA